MKRFTNLLENYKNKGLKSLSDIIVEEPTEDEFNKEFETTKKQSEGKIKKKISAPAVKAVEIQKEHSELYEEVEGETEEDKVHPIRKYTPKDVKGLYGYNHYEHPDGSWIQIRHGNTYNAIHNSATGGMKEFSSLSGLQRHVLKHHQVKESDECANKPIWGKPTKGYLEKAASKSGEKPDYSKTGKRYKDLVASAKKIKEEKEHTGLPKDNYKQYHNSYSDAVSHAETHLKSKGYEVPEDRTRYNGEPSKGGTNILHLKAHKKGENKRIDVHVYNNGSKHELSIHEDYDFQELDLSTITEETLNEWNASGHKMSKANKWIKANGFESDGHSKHPKLRHKDTGGTVTGFNVHGNEAGAEALRNTRTQIIKHHTDNKLKYLEL